MEIVYSLENQLAAEFLAMIKECKRFSYTPTIFIGKFHRDGAVATAKELGGSPKYHDGLERLWKEKRLDISVEAIMIKEKYNTLFTSEELKNAKHKLTELGYNLNKPT